MPDKTNTSPPEDTAPFIKDQVTNREAVREALLRLRRLGERLPEVDAAAVVRAGRDAAARGDH